MRSKFLAVGIVVGAALSGCGAAPTSAAPSVVAPTAADFANAHADTAKATAAADQMQMRTTWDTRTATGRLDGCFSWKASHPGFYSVVAGSKVAPWAGIPESSVNAFMRSVC